eukprot:scaffold77606_cov31-Tisochrysis_lutea.AAC.3
MVDNRGVRPAHEDAQKPPIQEMSKPNGSLDVDQHLARGCGHQYETTMAPSPAAHNTSPAHLKDSSTEPAKPRLHSGVHLSLSAVARTWGSCSPYVRGI